MLRRIKYALMVGLTSTLVKLNAAPLTALPEPLHLTWAQAATALSCSLLFLACLCLMALERRVRRKKDIQESRLAESLAGAFRAGVFNFDEPRRPAVPLWRLWVDPEEPPEPAPKDEPVVSRYRLLGYSDETAEPDEAVVSVRQFGIAHDPVPAGNEEALTRGIPREYLKPEHVVWRASSDASSALVEPAAGDDPRECVPQLDMLACNS